MAGGEQVNLAPGSSFPSYRLVLFSGVQINLGVQGGCTAKVIIKMNYRNNHNYGKNKKVTNKNTAADQRHPLVVIPVATPGKN
jgi:hypothetical protein